MWGSIKIPPTRFAAATFGKDLIGDVFTYEANILNQSAFVFEILPHSLFEENEDRPMLEGSSRKPVAGTGKTHLLLPEKGDGDSARFKWDLSRQFSVTILNPNGILRGNLGSGTSTVLFTNQPVTAQDQILPVDHPINFPTDPVEGNDDPIVDPTDENTDPYNQITGVLSHSKYRVCSSDAPLIPIEIKGFVNNGTRFAEIINFKEFVRLELWDGKRTDGRSWFRVVDYFDWHFSLDALYDSQLPGWINNSNSPSSTGAGHDLRQ